MRWSRNTYGCNVRVSTYIWPFSAIVLCYSSLLIFFHLPAGHAVFSFSVRRPSLCFYSKTDLSSEVTFIRALDWLLFIWPLPPSPAEEKWSAVEMWWKIKTLCFSLSLQWAFLQQTTANKILYKQFLKSAAMDEAGSTTRLFTVFLFNLTCEEQRGSHDVVQPRMNWMTADGLSACLLMCILNVKLNINRSDGWN